MKLRLKYWQLILLFSPFIWVIGSLFIPFQTRMKYHINGELICLLLFTIFMLAISYQVYLVIVFNKKIHGRWWIIINNIPSLLLVVLCVAGCATLAVEHFDGTAPADREDTKPDFLLAMMILVAFFIHQLITFFLINNLYVSAKLDKIKDFTLRENLTNNIWEPMKRLLIVSMLIFAASSILAVIAEIINVRVLQR